MIVWFVSCYCSVHDGFFINGWVVVYWSLPMFSQWQLFFISLHLGAPGQFNDSNEGGTKTVPLWFVIPQNVGLLFLVLFVRKIVTNIYWVPIMWQGHYKILHLKVGTFSSLCRWKNRALQRLNNSASVTWLVSGWWRRQTYITWAKAMLFPSLHTSFTLKKRKN